MVQRASRMKSRFSIARFILGYGNRPLTLPSPFRCAVLENSCMVGEPRHKTRAVNFNAMKLAKMGGFVAKR